MNINSITTSFANLLTSNNTTTATYDLSANLKTRVSGVHIGVANSHEKLPVPYTAYPLVCMQAESSTQEFNELGNSSRRNINIRLSAVGITYYGMGAGDERIGRQVADKEAMELAANIEAIFQNNITASSTVDWVLVDNVDYSANIGDGAYNSVVKINLLARKRQ